MVHNIHDIMYFNIKIISYQQFYGIYIFRFNFGICFIIKYLLLKFQDNVFQKTNKFIQNFKELNAFLEF